MVSTDITNLTKYRRIKMNTTTKFDCSKTYAAKSSVTRALKAAGLDVATFNILTSDDGKFYGSPKLTVKPAGEKKARTGVCKAVWNMADSMPEAKRSEVIAACVAAGYNLGTSKTQYQAWFASRG
jgi:hypothetical protein